MNDAGINLISRPRQFLSNLLRMNFLLQLFKLLIVSRRLARKLVRMVVQVGGVPDEKRVILVQPVQRVLSDALS